MKPFDLEKALAGEPVVTRDGRPVKISGYNEDLNSLLAWVGGSGLNWTGGGKSLSCSSAYDLFMAPTERKEWVVRRKDGTYLCFPYSSKELAEKATTNHPNSTIHEITITE